MKGDCTTCQHADWQRTKTGRLHPSGTGECLWDDWKEWKLPKAFWYISSKQNVRPGGGYINRRNPFTDCPFYQPILDCPKK